MGYTEQYPTIWPTDFDPNDINRLAGAVIVDEGDHSKSARNQKLHCHPVGQLTISIKGLVGVQLVDGIRAVPAQCAAWVPAGVPHCGLIGDESISIYMMVRDDEFVRNHFPKTASRLLLNTMTFEMIKRFARFQGKCLPGSHEENIARVIIEELAQARELPPQFAPLPEHPLMKRLAYLLTEESSYENNAFYADKLAMSERSLLRLVKAQTGMSFKRWRTHLVLMQSLSELSKGLPIEKIAYRAGYDYPSSFIESFKRVFGETPGQYRERFKD